ncbi:SMP-30/gluconolactonase/LRE family protein [Dyella dinghuensis]|uniref:SMP-30/gluconolactonase/LRE family protein n=1 Tax=Dyella dinghuensis TaxID=1920169 RepID=A0A3S0REW3_9GAMM|nr:SMP-30/gluconolactonase/LRE family protein [Dyella dinghuensis]RUL64521.1 SMP-30/gluconolactonase/LRE family protein [Dyella dinghuensis]
MTLSAALVLDARNTLGEGVTWCPRENVLYWTDIHQSVLWRFCPADNSTRQWRMPERLASFALCEDDKWLLLGLARGLAFFHLESGELIRIAEVEKGLPTRLNDGACDRQGRFVFGTLHEPAAGEARYAAGSFYRLGADRVLEKLPLGPVAISNSIAFSPDGATMYFCDSVTGLIRRCAYGDHVADAGVHIDLSHLNGDPDGSAVDAEGGLWNAQWGLGRVVRYDRNGNEDFVITVPTRQPTRIAFGGAHLNTLYITSARDGLSAEALAHDPHAGGLFAVDVPFTGIAEPRFAGHPA